MSFYSAQLFSLKCDTFTILIQSHMTSKTKWKRLNAVLYIHNKTSNFTHKNALIILRLSVVKTISKTLYVKLNGYSFANHYKILHEERKLYFTKGRQLCTSTVASSSSSDSSSSSASFSHVMNGAAFSWISAATFLSTYFLEIWHERK